MKICDPQGHELGLVKEKIITFLPKFELYEGGRHIGRISKKLSLFSPKFSIDFNGWQVEGNFLEWDYTIRDARGNWVATIGKELFHLSDTYVMEIRDPATPSTCSCSPWPWMRKNAAEKRSREIAIPAGTVSRDGRRWGKEKKGM